LIYESKYGKKAAELDPIEWMAALISHIPDRGAQTIRYPATIVMPPGEG